MVNMGSQRDLLYIINTPTDIECGKDVRFRRTFRSIVECVVPCCGFQPSMEDSSSDTVSTYSISSSPATVTGTFFGYRKGRVNFCIQENSMSCPLVLLEFNMPTSYLAKEMQSGVLRITFKCNYMSPRSSVRSLFKVPNWSMYLNGRKVGFAVKRRMNECDIRAFKLMKSVSVGAGVLPTTPRFNEGDLLYLRAKFERVIGSSDYESFHMINPSGSYGQELSVFFLKS